MGNPSLQSAERLGLLKTLSAEARFLLQALNADDSGPALSDWDRPRLLSLARSHRVLPLLCASSIELPADFFLESRGQIARSLMLSSVLTGLLERFHRAALEVICLKGPVLAQMLYGGPGSRPCDDLDFLVRAKDFAAAEAVLLHAGFSPCGPADGYHRDYEHDGVFIELHFNVASSFAPRLDLTAAWPRTRVVRFQGADARFFSPVDLVLYLALHGLKHRFSCLIWAFDCARAMDSLSAADSVLLLAESRRQGLSNVIMASCGVARCLFATGQPQWTADALARNPEIAGEARRMAAEILAADADPTTSPENSRDYLLFADPGFRWKQRLRFFRPTEQDYRWAARHGISRRCAALVRPVRLARKYGMATSLRLLFPRP